MPRPTPPRASTPATTILAKRLQADDLAAPATPVEASMRCLEVQGGSGGVSAHFTRPGLEIWLASQAGACRRAGGSDLYLLSSCASGRITRLLLADVCSYGAEFSTTAGDLRDTLKRYINVIGHARVVRRMGQQLAQAAQRGCFATMVLGTYFAPTHTFTLCSAGHAPPLLLRARSQTWSLLQPEAPATGVPVASPEPTDPGVLPPSEYQQWTLQLEEGDRLLCYSSVLAECRDHAGQTLGCEGILMRVQQLADQPPAQLVDQLVEGIRQAHPENLAVEDATLLLSQVTATPVPWLDNFLAPLRYWGAVSDKTHIDS